MRAALIALALVLTLDAALFREVRRLSQEREGLAGRLADLSNQAHSARRTGESERRVAEMIDRASSSVKYEATDIASLRDLLIAAERGLDIDRFSLDFRSGQEGAPGSRSGRIGATLGSTFHAVYDYLERVEELRLPLRLEGLSLREESSGRILLDVQWAALWGPGRGGPSDFSPAEMSRLEKWLSGERGLRPGRDPFSVVERPRAIEEVPLPVERYPISEEPPVEEPEAMLGPTPGAPELAGFVLARPELEKDVNRRVLAALRYEGQLLLVGTGEILGDYRVERIDARDRVLLVHLETGERVTLVLE